MRGDERDVYDLPLAELERDGRPKEATTLINSFKKRNFPTSL